MGGQGHPTPINTPRLLPLTNTHTQRASETFIFRLVRYGLTDQWTDKVSHISACPQLTRPYTRLPTRVGGAVVVMKRLTQAIGQE